MFGKKLKKALKDLSIQQKDLATLTGISNYSISRYANGHTEPTPETVEKIRKALGLPTGYFWEEEAQAVEPKKYGNIHKITLAELKKRTGLDEETLANAARERELPGLYACNQKSRVVFVINEKIFCNI